MREAVALYVAEIHRAYIAHAMTYPAAVRGGMPLLAPGPITEAAVGAPIRSSLETVEVGRTRSGAPVYFSRDALGTTGTLSAAPSQKRRVKSKSSGLGPASAVATSGSSAMPQIGQWPGPIWRICGCIGHV